MQKIVIGVIVALAIIGLGSYFLVHTNSASSDTATNTDTSQTDVVPTPIATSPTPTPVSTAKTYTLADVAKHATATSCWAAINDKVYDLTKWIPQHPGGPNRILSICGKDGSDAFNGQHSGQARPASELAGFYIADLAQ